MMISRNILFSVAAIGIYTCAFFAINQSNYSLFSFFNADKIEENKQNTIQVALLLDTSGSMNGLIEQAKSQLWNILNQLARTEKKGEKTILEIALYEYGNPSTGRNSYQINRLTPFTSDMDLISEKLFSLTTNGGNEYCGTIINTALNELEWKNEKGLKIIYIAGNEHFTQGPIGYVEACHKAQEKGITVNTIYCGDRATGILEMWEAGAIAGGGDFLTINHNQVTEYFKTPYDDQINLLNAQLNKTYIPYGSQGQMKQKNQMIQDQNAFKYSSANSADRAAFKSSSGYRNTDWDLVDAYTADKRILKDVKIIADTLQNLTADELEVRVIEIAEKRKTIQQEIQNLNDKRSKYKEENIKNTEDASLQKSMIKTLEKQAKALGYKIKN